MHARSCRSPCHCHRFYYLHGRQRALPRPKRHNMDLFLRMYIASTRVQVRAHAHVRAHGHACASVRVLVRAMCACSAHVYSAVCHVVLVSREPMCLMGRHSRRHKRGTLCWCHRRDLSGCSCGRQIARHRRLPEAIIAQSHQHIIANSLNDIAHQHSTASSIHSETSPGHSKASSINSTANVDFHYFLTGTNVGPSDGARVGLLVGDDDGAVVGSSVGESDGVSDGAALG